MKPYIPPPVGRNPWTKSLLILVLAALLGQPQAHAGLLVRELWDNVGNGVLGGCGDGTTSLGFEPSATWSMPYGTYIKAAPNFNVTQGNPDTIPGLPYSGGAQGGLWGDQWTPGGGLWDSGHWATRQLANGSQVNLGADGEYWFAVRINNGGDSAGGVGLASAGDSSAEFIGAGAMWNNAGGGAANNSVYVTGGALGAGAGPYSILANSPAGTINGRGLLIIRLVTSAAGYDTVQATTFLPGSTLPESPSGITWQVSYSFASSVTATHFLLWMNGGYPFEMDAIYMGHTYNDVAIGPMLGQDLTVAPATTVYAGVPLTFNVTAVGVGPFGYQWRRDGTVVASTSVNTYMLANPAVSDSGNWDVVVTNATGSCTSRVVAVTVNPANPPILAADVSPATATRWIRGHLVLSTLIDGTPPFTFQWKRDGASLPAGTNSVLVVDDLTLADAGSYVLYVTNAFGWTNTTAATLTMQTPAAGSYEEMVVTNKPLAYWRLNEGTAPFDMPLAAGEYMGGYDAYHTNTLTFEGLRPPMQLGMEPTNQAALYQGAAASSTTASLMNNLAQFTLMGWFNPAAWPQQTSTGSGRVALFGQNDAAEFGFHGTNVVGMWTPGGGFVSFNAATLISANTWYFITAIGTGSNVTFYLNGNQAAQVAQVTTNYGSSSYPFRIGYGVLDAGQNEFNGTIDEVALFNRAWSVEEVNALYGKAIGVAQPPTILTDPVGGILYATLSKTFSVTAGGTLPLSYQWRFGGAPIPGATGSSFTLTNLSLANSGSYDVVVTNRAGVTNSAAVGLTVLVPTPGSYEESVVALNPVAYYRLNETAGSGLAYDFWGGNNATVQAGAVLGQPGPINPPFVGFDAANTALRLTAGTADSWADCPAFNLNTNTVTLSAWVYADGNQGGWRGIVFSRAGGTTAGLHVGNGNELRYSWNNTDDSWSWDSGLQIPVGKWCLVAGVIEPDRVTLYLGTASGLQSVTRANTHAIEEFNGGTAIGRDPGFGTNRVWNGLIDEVMIVKQALAPATMLALYQRAIPVSATVSLQAFPAVVADSKPSGPRYNGLGYDAAWVASSTDPLLRTRTGVMEFTETNRSRVILPAHPEFNTPKGAMCFWIRTADLAVNNGAMIIDRRGGNGEILVLNPGGAVTWQPSWLYSDSTAMIVADGNWHHVAYVYDQSATGYSTVYIDGNLDKTHVNPGAWNWDLRPIEIGLSHDGYWDGFNGQLDDIRFYNRELTSAEVLQIYAGDVPLVGGAELVGRYDFTTDLLPGLKLVWQIGVLESSDRVEGPYAPAAGATSPWLVEPSEAQRFYRTRLP